MFDQLYEAINGILIRMNQLSANVEQKNQEIGHIQDQLKIFEEKNQILEKTVNLLESHHKEFEKVISSNNGFPLTRVFLTMNGKNQPNIKSYAQYDYKIPELGTKLVEWRFKVGCQQLSSIYWFSRRIFNNRTGIGCWHEKGCNYEFACPT